MNEVAYKPKFVFAGIGSRETPGNMQAKLAQVTRRLANLGGQCRSGNAAGADISCQWGVHRAIEEDGVDPLANQIYLPWKAFNFDCVPQCYGAYYDSFTKESCKAAEDLMSQLHPKWASLSRGARTLHTRNVFQVYGPDVDEQAVIDFVVCWTPDGVEHHSRVQKETGGTGSAIRMASLLDIPVFNLFNPDALNRLAAHLKTLNLSE